LPDIFELALEEKQKTIFERALEEKNRKTIFEQVDKAVPKLVRDYIRSHKMTPPQTISLAQILSIVKDEVKKIPIPEKVIERETKIIEKKTDTKYVEESKYLDLLVKISKLESQLKETRRMAESPIVIDHGGPGVIGIPPPEPNPDGYLLTVNKGKAVWATASASGGVSPDVYTVSNVTTDRSYDATDTSLDEISMVLGSLIQSLQNAGIIQ
jgi:HEPN domain-containing protein